MNKLNLSKIIVALLVGAFCSALQSQAFTTIIDPTGGSNGTPGLVIKESGIESPYARITLSGIQGSRDYYFRGWLKSAKGGHRRRG